MHFYCVYDKIYYMAQYKVPQDVEAEDKLLGPFTFRQFIYLLIAAAGIAGAWGLFQLFPLLAIIPLPFVLLFGILALPVKKDQPMETYLAAVASFYLKPNRRIWKPGQRESTILITAPKTVEKARTRDITEEEASHRLSFLADIVDSEGYAIRNDSSMRDEYAAEANQLEDILDANNKVIDNIIAKEQAERKSELLAQMRTAMNRADEFVTPNYAAQQQVYNQRMNELATNQSLSVSTIAQQANRIQQQQQYFQQQAQPQTYQNPQPYVQPYPQQPYTTQPQPFVNQGPTLPMPEGYTPTYQAFNPEPTPVQNNEPPIPGLYGQPTAIFSPKE